MDISSIELLLDRERDVIASAPTHFVAAVSVVGIAIFFILRWIYGERIVVLGPRVEAAEANSARWRELYNTLHLDVQRKHPDDTDALAAVLRDGPRDVGQFLLKLVTKGAFELRGNPFQMETTRKVGASFAEADAANLLQMLRTLNLAIAVLNPATGRHEMVPTELAQTMFAMLKLMETRAGSLPET
jgi:hypothetical protein